VPAHLRAAVARELDEVERVREPQRAREVGQEDEARLERADEQRQLALRVVPSDLAGELTDPSTDLLGREIDLPDPGIERPQTSQLARSRRKC
jgi:hypothetical protein